MWSVYTMEYYSATKKEGNLAFCTNMDGPRGCYAKWNKSNRERQMLCNLTFMWNLKKNKLMDTENRLMVDRGWEVGVGEMGEVDKKVQPSWGCNVQHGDYS